MHNRTIFRGSCKSGIWCLPGDVPARLLVCWNSCTNMGTESMNTKIYGNVQKSMSLKHLVRKRLPLSSFVLKFPSMDRLLTGFERFSGPKWMWFVHIGVFCELTRAITLWKMIGWSVGTSVTPGKKKILILLCADLIQTHSECC